MIGLRSTPGDIATPPTTYRRCIAEPAPPAPPPEPGALPDHAGRQALPDHDQRCVAVAWSGPSREVVRALAAAGAGVSFIACAHPPSDRPAASLHLDAIRASLRRSCGCEPPLAATGQRVDPDELFGWAYERPTGRLLRVPGTDPSWLPERRGGRSPRLDYGPFSPIAVSPQAHVWFKDLNALRWGFACLLVPARAAERNATAIAALTPLIDEVLLERPGDEDEAFHWDLHAMPNAGEVVGYDAWTVRTSRRRIVVIRATTCDDQALIELRRDVDGPLN